MQYIKVIDVRRTSIVPAEPDNRMYERVVRKGYAEMERIQRMMVHQRIAGVVLLIIAVVSVPFLDGNGIALVMFTPLAMWLMFGRTLIRAGRVARRTWRRLKMKAR